MNNTQLPPGLIPSKWIELCTNTLVNVQTPVQFDGVPVLLIGDGQVPEIWIAAPPYPGTADWTYVVRRSKPFGGGIQVDLNGTAKTTRITFSGSTIIEARGYADGSVRVDRLDLRPMGLPVYGDPSGLQVGGYQLRNNRIEGIDVAFEFRRRPDSSLEIA